MRKKATMTMTKMMAEMKEAAAMTVMMKKKTRMRAAATVAVTVVRTVIVKLVMTAEVTAREEKKKDKGTITLWKKIPSRKTTMQKAEGKKEIPWRKRRKKTRMKSNAREQNTVI